MSSKCSKHEEDLFTQDQAMVCCSVESSGSKVLSGHVCTEKRFHFNTPICLSGFLEVAVDFPFCQKERP